MSTLTTTPRQRGSLSQENMYRQLFDSPTGSLTIAIPQSWHGQTIEVIAFPVSETFGMPNPSMKSNNKILENRRKREENSRKYAVSFKSLGYVFNREEANNYDE